MLKGKCTTCGRLGHITRTRTLAGGQEKVHHDFMKLCFKGDTKHASCLLGEGMHPKPIHDDSANAGKGGVLISPAGSVHKLFSFLRFTNDDHYGKFSNRIFCCKHGILFSTFLEPLSGFDVHEAKSWEN